MIFTGTPLEAILGESKVEKVTAGGRTFKTDAVVLSVGVRPNTAFLEDSGIEMVRRTIKVNEYMETNIEDIYAVGDCAMVTNALTKAPAWSPMGSTANITGRICAKNIAGKGPKAAYKGVLGTAVVKLPGLNGARTGLTEAGAADAGFDPVSVCTVVDDKAHYYPDASFFIVKMIADRNTKKLLGLQVLGAGAVDKMVDIAAMGMYMDATIDDLADMDLAYAPPFSTAIHPLVHTVNVLLNKMSGEFKTMTPAEYANGAAEGYRIIDASINPAIEGVTYVDLATVEGEVPGLAKDEKLLLVCTKGKRGYMLQNRLKYYGYTNTLVLEGGDTLNEIEV
jgi:rhodanese-related sulfurtransferase